MYDVRYLEPVEIAKLVPHVNLEGVLGGSICPRDGTADPNTVTQTFGSEAKKRGVYIETETNVLGIETQGGRVGARGHRQGRYRNQYRRQLRRTVGSENRQDGGPGHSDCAPTPSVFQY